MKWVNHLVIARSTTALLAPAFVTRGLKSNGTKVYAKDWKPSKKSIGRHESLLILEI